jgi:hypothetical protein
MTKIIRCLKRYIYHALVADLLPMPGSSRRRHPIVFITCSAGPIRHTVMATRPL